MDVPRPRGLLPALLLLLPTPSLLSAQAAGPGLRGDPEAIRGARAMVEALGGAAIWAELDALHFVHEWDVVNRPDRYLEHEVLDLTDARSWVSMTSEIRDQVRAYSPEHGYWTWEDGELSRGDEARMEAARARAPFNLYRLARAVARNDSTLRVDHARLPHLPDLPLEALRFSGPDDVPGGWILLNTRNEPILWETTQYVYVFGPLARFGNLRVPEWATTADGLIRYQMVELTGDDARPPLELFAAPEPGGPVRRPAGAGAG